MSASAPQIQQAVAAVPDWYHTIDLPGGVSTPGFVDWRGHAGRVVPGDLDGLRVLDVGTFDGFWAFEFERRGAREVVAIDLDRLDEADWPPVHRARLATDAAQRDTVLGRGFHVARESLGSSVTRVVCNVLELTPEAIGGPVDVAFIGALLLHLRDPVRALENVRRSLRPDGRLVMVEAISLPETLLHPRTPLARFDTGRAAFNWWLPNLCALRQYLWAAGFETPRRIGGLMRPPARPEMRGWYAALSARAPSAG
jgi:SAM-dependent methyltransferase